MDFLISFSPETAKRFCHAQATHMDDNARRKLSRAPVA
jgi:hypothetical protein